MFCIFIDFIIGMIINKTNIEIKIIEPIKPNCSAKIENTKSVSFSGIKSKLDCDPVSYTHLTLPTILLV